MIAAFQPAEETGAGAKAMVEDGMVKCFPMMMRSRSRRSRVKPGSRGLHGEYDPMRGAIDRLIWILPICGTVHLFTGFEADRHTARDGGVSGLERIVSFERCERDDGVVHVICDRGEGREHSELCVSACVLVEVIAGVMNIDPHDEVPHNIAAIHRTRCWMMPALYGRAPAPASQC